MSYFQIGIRRVSTTEEIDWFLHKMEYEFSAIRLTLCLFKPTLGGSISGWSDAMLFVIPKMIRRSRISTTFPVALLASASAFSQDGKPEPIEPPNKPPLTILAVNVIERDVKVDRKCSEPINLPANQPTQTLHGPGDLEVSFSALDFKRAQDHSSKIQKPSRLFVNGINMGEDAKLVGTLACSDQVHVRYQLQPGLNSQKLWGAIYRSSGLVKTEHLTLAIGWDGSGPSSVPGPSIGERQVAVTTFERQLWAFILALALILWTLQIFFKTDAFRDVPSPQWAKRANALYKKRPRVGLDAWLKREVDSSFDVARKPDYAKAVDELRDGKLPTTAAEEKSVLFGLLGRDQKPDACLGSFSLARTQVGLWFLFAVASGVFLWLVYGQLPQIDKSLLLLLGLSVTTAGVSIAIDNGNTASPAQFTLSNGLLNDLLTGRDSKDKVYRYQALVVNVLLLVVGAFYVAQDLSYPVFDSTWLAFLGSAALHWSEESS